MYSNQGTTGTVQALQVNLRQVYTGEVGTLEWSAKAKAAPKLACNAARVGR